MRVAGGCRGISDSVPYILELLQKTPGILVLSEHWLWPYELHKLSEISENLKATGKADARLSDNVSSGRGFGGIGIMWHEGIGASPVERISSDQICAIRCSLDKSATTVLTVIGVYLPCLDQGIDCYSSHLLELEKIICESQLLGRVMVVGDFNAHLGVLGGEKGRGKPNLQGVLLSEVMDRCRLSAVSLGSIATGSDFTFFSGTSRTTVDYVFADSGIVSLMSGCHTLFIDDLNTSDHVPIVANICLSQLP